MKQIILASIEIRFVEKIDFGTTISNYILYTKYMQLKRPIQCMTVKIMKRKIHIHNTHRIETNFNYFFALVSINSYSYAGRTYRNPIRFGDEIKIN